MPEPSSWFKIGHATNEQARTGCSVILFDQLVPVAVDVRGAAPGTRETDLLASDRLVARADAILLTGGSAFGLAAADGVVRYLSERGRGFPTSVIPVPIVPAAVIFDLGVGHPDYPSGDDGYHAAMTASQEVRGGKIGAGAGATVAKIAGGSTPSGIGIGHARAHGSDVVAIVVLNAVGDVVDPETARRIATAVDPDDRSRSGRELAIDGAGRTRPGENTTLGVILVSSAVSREALQRCCVAAHAALARCVVPAHTIFDGDTFFAAAPALAEVSPPDILAIGAATELAVERAVVSVFKSDQTATSGC